MNNVIAYLLNYAFQHEFDYIIMNDAPSIWPSVACPQRNLMFINLNWENKTEIPFQLAHEIGHMLEGNTCYMYNDFYRVKIQSENQADLHAIDLLRQYCLDNDISFESSIIFAQQFGIPSHLYEIVQYRWYA